MATASRAGPRGSSERRPGHRISWWWLNRSVRVKGVTVLAIPMLAFVAVTVSAVGLQRQERTERAIAVQARVLSQAANALLVDALNAEAGVRGYALTGDAIFLAPYRDSLSRQRSDVAALRTAATTGNQPAQATRIAASFEAMGDLLENLRASVHPGVSHSAAVTAEFRAEKVVMDRLRREVTDIAGAPSELVTSSTVTLNRLESNIQAVELVGLAIGLLAGLAGIALFTSGIARRIQLAAANAGRLGKSVPLVPVEHSRDELGQLGVSLAHAERLMSSRLHELAAARDQAVLATQTKNTFLSRTSHELRTPLNAILGFAQLLEMSELGADDRDSAEHILTAGRHLLSLINEIIDTARVESGELRLSLERVWLAGLTTEVASLISPLAAARNITVTKDRGDGALAVYADKQRLRQVMVNLASNAVKYNHLGGMITIGYRRSDDDDETVVLSVSDTGPGLTEDEISRIFVPFERLEAEQHGIEGTGIGLPLALALTEAMHGVLDVASVPGDGATFTVRLPQAPSEYVEVEDGEFDAAAAMRSLGSDAEAPEIAVLSIEDNPANALLLSRFFKDWSCATLYSASTAEAGIAMAMRQHPDVILLDLHLPDLPGEEVFTRLRAEAATAKIPVIVLSADATPGTVRRLLARGVSGYLTKPVNLRELHDLVTDVAAAHALRLHTR